MNKKIFGLVLLIFLASNFLDAQSAARRPFNKVQLEAHLARVQNSTESDMNLMNAIYKELLLRYWSEIEWLEKNYVVDKAKGDALIKTIAAEPKAIEMLKKVASNNCKNLYGDLSESDHATCQNMLLQMLVLEDIQGLKERMEIKSSVYQELLAKKKIN